MFLRLRLQTQKDTNLCIDILKPKNHLSLISQTNIQLFRITSIEINTVQLFEIIWPA